MKKLLLLFNLVCTTVAFGQSVTVAELQAKAKTEKIKDILINYDRFKDAAIVYTKPQNLIGSGEGGMAIFGRGMIGPAAGPTQTLLYLSIGYAFKGDKLADTPNIFAVAFKSNSSDWVYLKGDKNLYILYDDQRLVLNSLGTDSDVNLGMFYDVTVSETLGFAISRNDLQKIIEAKKVEFKLGDTKPRQWKPDWSKRIQQLLTLTTLK